MGAGLPSLSFTPKLAPNRGDQASRTDFDLRDHKECGGMALCFGRAYQVPTIALRYFNIFGARQSMDNPYTGVLAIFLSRLLNGKPPLVFEDGLQSRDFVHVHDIARANVRAVTSDQTECVALNVGTGRPTTVLTLAR